MLCCLRTPDLPEKLLPRHEMSRVPEEHFDHSKLHSRQRNVGAIGTKGSPGSHIDREIVGLNGGWLGHEVVSAGVEHGHDVGLPPHIRCHHDRHFGSSSQLSYQLRRIQRSRIDHHGVTTVCSQMLDGLLSGSDRGNFAPPVSECRRLRSAQVLIGVQENNRHSRQSVGRPTLSNSWSGCPELVQRVAHDQSVAFAGWGAFDDQTGSGHEARDGVATHEAQHDGPGAVTELRVDPRPGSCVRHHRDDLAAQRGAHTGRDRRDGGGPHFSLASASLSWSTLMYDVPMKPSSVPCVWLTISLLRIEGESPVAFDTIGIWTRASCWLMSGS